MKSILSKILHILTPDNRRGVVVLMILMFFGMLLEMIGVGLVVPVIVILTQNDIVTTHPELQMFLGGMGDWSQKTLIAWAMILLLAGYLFKNLFLAFLAWKQTRFSFDLYSELSKRLFSIYLSQPYTFHLQRNSALLIRNVRAEVAMFAQSVITPVMNIISETLVLFGICILLLIVEPLGMLIVMAVLGVATSGFYYITKGYVVRWGQARQYHDRWSLQHLTQGLGGIKDLKILGREAEFLKEFDTHTSQGAKMNQLQTTLQQMPRLWLELLGVIALVAMVLNMLNQGKEISTIAPTLGLFAAAAFRLMPSVNRIISAVQQLRYSYPAVNTLYEELSLPLENRENNGITSLKNKIEIKDVSYTYPDSSELSLYKIDLKVKKGESIGIIGPSGSGKSTLVDILLGLLVPTDGKIKIDGQDILSNLRSWQDQVGYVPQSIYLTDDTLKRNIAFGLSESQIDNVAVDKAIKAAQLEGFVSDLPEGTETMVGEHGVRLSGGQRQRIGIARALYHDPSVLVLDEATSALDVTTEKEVMKAITALQGNKTIFIVAHRLSTVENCDCLYKLEQGRIVAEGAPEDILSVKQES
jgi:ATP-binding cassette, subfamily B, bacterial PglK